MILLMITLELRMILKNIWRSILGNVLNKLFPSSNFPHQFFSARFHRNCQAVLAAVSINGLNSNLDFFQILSSGTIPLLTITSWLRMILQNTQRRVTDNVLINISLWDIFPNMLLPARFHLNCQTDFDHLEHLWMLFILRVIQMAGLLSRYRNEWVQKAFIFFRWCGPQKLVRVGRGLFFVWLEATQACISPD